MRFHENVSSADRERLNRAVSSIKRFGDRFHIETANFLENTEIVIFVDLAKNVSGSGSVRLDDEEAAREAVEIGNLGVRDAARFVRLNIARETIDIGGQRGIEGTLVHEGKHARDFALILSSYSNPTDQKIFNPTAFQREYSAHLTAAFYLMRRGGEFTEEGLSLGLLLNKAGKISVNKKGIQHRLRNNYGLTEETPGGRLNESANPKIGEPRKKFLGLF